MNDDCTARLLFTYCDFPCGNRMSHAVIVIVMMHMGKLETRMMRMIIMRRMRRDERLGKRGWAAKIIRNDQEAGDEFNDVANEEKKQTEMVLMTTMIINNDEVKSDGYSDSVEIINDRFHGVQKDMQEKEYRTINSNIRPNSLKQGP